MIREKISLTWKLMLYTLIMIILYIEFFTEAGLGFILGLAYFTTQSNLLVAACLFVFIVIPKQHRAKSIMRGISLVAIIITGIVYNFVMHNVFRDWNAGGYFFTAIVTHLVVPIGYTLDWILFDEHGHMKWKDIMWWVIYPLLYVLFSVFAGSRMGLVLYFFLDVSAGYVRLLGWLALLFFMIILVSCLIVGLDKMLRRGKGNKKC